MKGYLIVIEGNNASGKATQARLLVKRLTSAGRKTVEISFPQYTSTTGKVIGRYLRGEFGDVRQISPYFVSTLYAFDRLALKEKILGWLSKGYVVVTDRYVESNKAFQAAKLKTGKERKAFASFVDQLEYSIGKLPKPSAVIYLDVPLTVAALLHDKKSGRTYIGKKRDIHERNLSYLKDVEKMYQWMAKKDKWIKLRCMRSGKLLPKQEISDQVLYVVKKIISTSL